MKRLVVSLRVHYKDADFEEGRQPDMADQYNNQDQSSEQYTSGGTDTDTDTDLGQDQYTNWDKGTYQYPNSGAGNDLTTDQYGNVAPYGTQPQGSTPGGEGLYGDADQYDNPDPYNDQNLDRHGNPYAYGGMGGPVAPGSEKDQYGTRGSQDQYGNQQ